MEILAVLVTLVVLVAACDAGGAVQSAGGAVGAAWAGGRIVGGVASSIEQHPALLQVEAQGLLTGVWTQSCAGAVLTSRFLLSAAHCFSGVTYAPTLRRVRAGSTWRGQGGSVHGVLVARVHPDYNVVQREADLAVVQLSDALTLDLQTVAAATIVAPDVDIPDELPVLVAGWGTLESGGVSAEQLQEVEVLTVNRDVCRTRYRQMSPILNSYPVTERMLCAGLLDVGGKDACQGDSGGPLYLNNVIVGIVAWGIGCADAYLPGVYTAVSPFTNWIVDVVQTAG